MIIDNLKVKIQNVIIIINFYFKTYTDYGSWIELKISIGGKYTIIYYLLSLNNIVRWYFKNQQLNF